MRRVLPVLAAVLALAGCGGKSTPSQRTPLTIVVNAPFSRSPYLGRTIENGARLAVQEVNANGLRIGDTTYELRVRTLDTALSPARAVANCRSVHSTRVGDQIPTRSPFSIPSPSSPRATLSTSRPSSPYVSRISW